MNGDEHEHGREENFIKNTRQISLEKYSTLLSSSADLSSFTLRQLNTILSIHGIKQMDSKKEQLMDVVSKLEIKDFARCTLGEDIQPAPMSQAIVVRDLALLNWQTCPVVSVRSITSPHCTTNAKAAVARKPLQTGIKKSRKRKKKMKQLSGLPKSPGIKGRSDSGLGEDSVDQSVSGGGMSNRNSGSSSTIAGENSHSGSKRKRKANQKGLEYFSSGAMMNLGLQLGIFDQN